MKRWAWKLALCVIAPAAAGIVAWSLYVVAHDMYGVPAALAALVGACFDGAALACLYLASEATRENRSAAAPRLATLGLAGISIYLNRLHALHIDGGLGATLMFAAPTVALLLLADLSWAATRAQHRAARGEKPMRVQTFGILGWALARKEAWKATKQRAVAHVAGQQPATADPVKRTPGEVLESELASLSPSKAIQIMHESRPTLTLAQLAEVLRQYGQKVTELDVAIVLGRVPRPETVTVTRDDTVMRNRDAPPPQQVVITVQQPEAIAPVPSPERSATGADDAVMRAGQAAGAGEQLALDEPPSTDRIVADAVAGAGRIKADAVRAVRAVLPADTSHAEVARHLLRNGVDADDAYVRTIASRDRQRAAKNTTPEPGTGFYN